MMLDILSGIHDFCQEKGLRYFLAYGSLIGAVRHKGFIPWDDDIDIWMPRPDFKRFVREFRHPFFKVLSPFTDPAYPLDFIKVHDERTIVEEAGGDGNWGIFADIFVFDGVPSQKVCNRMFNRIITLRRFVANQRFTRKLPVSRNNGLGKNMRIVLGKMFSPFLSMNRLLKRQMRLMAKYDLQDSPYVADFLMPRPLMFGKDVLDERKLVDFEDRKYYIPARYDLLLSSYYGDYMSLPRPEHRVSNHGAVAYWKLESLTYDIPAIEVTKKDLIL